MNWWHNGFGQKKIRAGTRIRSQLNDELFNCTSTKEDLGTDTPSKTEPVEVKGSIVVTEYKPIPDLEYLQENHIYTSGASGTNAAIIREALRADKPELLLSIFWIKEFWVTDLTFLYFWTCIGCAIWILYQRCNKSYVLLFMIAS